MYNPTRDQARSFFVVTWKKRGERLPLTPLETIAADLIAQHPEYHALLATGEASLARDWTPETGQANPFLHLSLHLAIEEQLGIDQPPGLRSAFDGLLRRHGDRHAALHDILECLGEIVWRSQRDKAPPDGSAYLECIKAKAGLL
jgi:hypothetical protein